MFVEIFVYINCTRISAFNKCISGTYDQFRVKNTSKCTITLQIVQLARVMEYIMVKHPQKEVAGTTKSVVP